MDRQGHYQPVTLDEARRYHMNHRYRTIQTQMAEWALELGHFPQGCMMLDAACGTGLGMAVLADKGYKPYGFDVDPNMLYVADEKGFIVRPGNFLDIPYPDSFFEGFISISAFQHAGVDDPFSTAAHKYQQAAAELYRTCTGNGVIQFYPADEQDRADAASALSHYYNITYRIMGEGTNNQKEFLVLEPKGVPRRDIEDLILEEFNAF